MGQDKDEMAIINKKSIEQLVEELQFLNSTILTKLDDPKGLKNTLIEIDQKVHEKKDFIFSVLDILKDVETKLNSLQLAGSISANIQSSIENLIKSKFDESKQEILAINEYKQMINQLLCEIQTDYKNAKNYSNEITLFTKTVKKSNMFSYIFKSMLAAVIGFMIGYIFYLQNQDLHIIQVDEKIYKVSNVIEVKEHNGNLIFKVD